MKTLKAGRLRLVFFVGHKCCRVVKSRPIPNAPLGSLSAGYREEVTDIANELRENISKN
ncbi:MAG: hypothetical protein ACI4A2_04845 [Candidatus Cryptobacteroides sp.]